MLIDKFERKIDYIRVSVTSRCNFRCLYCMPNTPFEWEPHENILRYEEMFEFLRLAIDEGINKIRLTGGEPLLRKDLDVFVKMLHDYRPDLDLALTTNGYYLKEYAKKLKDAGLKRVNMSLDSLKPEVAAKIAQKDVLNRVIQGLDEALKVGLKVKLNTVVMQGINDTEILDLLEFAKNKGVTIRFIEFMENERAYPGVKRVDSKVILDKIAKKYKFKELPKDNSASRYFETEDGYVFGIIEPHNEDFCKSCNRIRLTAEGYLIPCLFFTESYNIKEALREGNIQKASEILREVVANKPEKNDWQDEEVSTRAFWETGG
ncbi:molybdenum cofactor biosynthesis protein A [Nautilia profundicola AmH]|uniref:GTP 3',8-cyclase n=1 Tax=Nautilia profundicola (strain ATCC BAA-1463 / DSM 18972 / AmH) TaxID=598659 RepID=MOAA_NAUPA|nr:GTP 3',8-cyclase MoaA [Nautilia profundicola]B9L851.1 RecName: Full=GTP 3',8-cyclase; AltName: Full=Molybdenum cofactor biosynthesis protein A [Nautilia profundicola AmH]ACM92895.1 molybdenum cofactor biosynthesis protein A [Nautilia profundicola AmH]